MVEAPTTEAQAKAFITMARGIYLNMQTPTSDYNAWAQVGGYGRDVVTWTDPEDIVFILRGDMASYIDVNVLASAFNIDRTTLLGNIIYVNNFNQYDNEGNLIFDGSNIIGFMGDKAWFKIKDQDMEMDNFYNANNRTWQYYLNLVRMYSYSLFANGVVFTTQAPEVTITGLTYNAPEGITINGIGEVEGLEIATTPAAANTPAITYTVAPTDVVSIEKINNKNIKLTSLKAGTATITATAGAVTTTVNVNVTA